MSNEFPDTLLKEIPDLYDGGTLIIDESDHKEDYSHEKDEAIFISGNATSPDPVAVPSVEDSTPPMSKKQVKKTIKRITKLEQRVKQAEKELEQKEKEEEIKMDNGMNKKVII